MPHTKPFTTEDIPSLVGKVALVTGATGGLGFDTALALCAAGGKVLLGGRNETKGAEAIAKIKAAHPSADATFALIDHGSLASVSQFATNYNATGEPLDILVNNAGIMTPPNRLTTSDNFEIQLGTNHLAHFALTGQLLPSLRRSSSPRVVNVSSLMARRGKIHFNDMQFAQSYSALGAYSQSKLANLLFSLELQTRSDQNGWGLTVVSAHPGISDTGLVDNGPGNSFLGKFTKVVVKPFFMQSSARGALPQLYAATSLAVEKNGFYGPNGFYEIKGDVGQAWVPPFAKDKVVAKRFWEESEKLTNFKWAN